MRCRSIVTTGITVVPRNSGCMMESSCRGGIGIFYAGGRAREASRRPGRKAALTLPRSCKPITTPASQSTFSRESPPLGFTLDGVHASFETAASRPLRMRDVLYAIQ
jgi:hypothetical protein